MLTESTLRALLTNLESENIERTRSFDKADKMGQAISAFANDLANREEFGYLLLGVENDGRISGKRCDDQRLSSLGSLKTDGNLLPPPAISITQFSLPEGDVVVIEVAPSLYPPIRYKGQVWVRVGPRKALATDEDIHLLEERRNRFGSRFEEMPCTNARLTDLDLELFQYTYLPRAIASDIIEEDGRPVTDQLASLRFWDRKTESPTNLGVMLFGNHPELFLPSSYIQYVHFAGRDNGSEILGEHAFKGPLLKTVNDLSGFVEAGLASHRPIRISAFEERNVQRYPDWAIRELLLNAIIHRDYQLGNSPIRFYEYGDDRLEIFNPGGLFGLAKPENFPFVSDYRNPLLAESMKIMGFVNRFNRGISKVKAEMERNGNPPPVFDVNHLTEFRVTLRTQASECGVNETSTGFISPNGEINSTESDFISPSGEINLRETPGILPSGEITLFRLIDKCPGIKRNGMAKRSGISLRTIDRLLRKLKCGQKIEYRGSKKTGGWYIRT